MDFGVFVCSACSGIHREMTHKVKGFGMCNFNEHEIEILTKNGNEVTFITEVTFATECLKIIDGQLQFKTLP